jgi:Uma2 family endonuclease
MSLVLDPPAKPKAVTPEELLAMPDGDRYELVNGRLKELSVGVKSSFVAGMIYYLLARFLSRQRQGDLFPEGTSFQCFGDRTVRKPDCSFLRAGRLTPAIWKAGHCPLVPDLAVEVLSPNDVHLEVTAKLEDYFAVGVPLVWLVDPEFRVVTVYRGGWAIQQRLTEHDELTGEPVLPGFTCRVAECFPPAELTAAPAPPESPA